MSEWLEKCLAKCIQPNSCVICYERACTYVCTCGAQLHMLISNKYVL
jgi:hypothetical protein